MLLESRAESNKLCCQTMFPSFLTEEKCFFLRPLKGDDSGINLDLGLFSSLQLHVQPVFICVWAFWCGCLESSYFFLLRNPCEIFCNELMIPLLSQTFHWILPQAPCLALWFEQVAQSSPGDKFIDSWGSSMSLVILYLSSFPHTPCFQCSLLYMYISGTYVRVSLQCPYHCCPFWFSPPWLLITLL